MSQLSEIRSDVQDNWPTNYHSTVLTNSKTDEFINLAQRWVCRKHNFTFMEQTIYRNTVDEQRQYSLPDADDSNWTEIYSGTVRKFKSEMENGVELRDANSYRRGLTKIFKSDIKRRRRFLDTTDKGRPSHYCMSQDYIELYDLPDHSYNSDTAWQIYMEFYGYLGDLSGDTDENEITEQYPEVLEYYATALGYGYGEDSEREAYWKEKARAVLADMIREDDQRKLGSIEEGMQPAAGQSLGGQDQYEDLDELTAHYE